MTPVSKTRASSLQPSDFEASTSSTTSCRKVDYSLQNFVYKPRQRLHLAFYPFPTSTAQQARPRRRQHQIKNRSSRDWAGLRSAVPGEAGLILACGIWPIRRIPAPVLRIHSLGEPEASLQLLFLQPLTDYLHQPNRHSQPLTFH